MGSRAPLSYGGVDYQDTSCGWPGCAFLAGGPDFVVADDTGVYSADGTGDFHVVLFHDTTNGLYETWYLRSDLWGEPKLPGGFFDAYEGGVGAAIDRVDYYCEEGAFPAQGRARITSGAVPNRSCRGSRPPPRLAVGVGSGSGVALDSATGCSISDNLISENTDGGISITASTAVEVTHDEVVGNGGIGVVWDAGSREVAISENSVYGNGGLGIDLLGDGVTPNDGDNDDPAKPDRGYDFPAFSAGGFPLMDGKAEVSGTAPPGARVESYYPGAVPDPGGHGRGQTCLGHATADADGSLTASLSDLAGGGYLSAIAISPAGDPSGAGSTSEFPGSVRLRTAYRVGASVSGGHGTVDPGSQVAFQGDSATVNIHPESNHHVASIADDGTYMAVANPYVIQDVRAHHDVVATFAADEPPPPVVPPGPLPATGWDQVPLLLAAGLLTLLGLISLALGMIDLRR